MTMRRRVRDAEDARRLVEQWADSGLSMAAWCAQNGIVRQSLQWWRGPGAGSASAVMRVAEVVLPSPPPEYRIVLTNGREVIVGDFAPDVLSDLLAVVDP
jgi:transposase-like protein